MCEGPSVRGRDTPHKHCLACGPTEAMGLWDAERKTAATGREAFVAVRGDHPPHPRG
jgi:hypothetical protein